MKWPKRFCLWRVRVWDRRLAVYRHDWQAEIDGADEHQHPEALNAVTVDQFWERLVTQAQLKRVKWRKRAGIRKLSGPSGTVKP